MATKINTGVGDPQWESWSLERTREAIERLDPTRTTQQAFLNMVRDRIFKTGRLDDEKHCSNVIREMMRTGELPLKLEIQNALTEAWQSSPYQRCDANDLQVLQEALGGGLVDIADAQSLLEIIERLGAQQNWLLNPEGEHQRQEQRAAEHRQSLIVRIAEGRATYPLWATRYGGFKWLQCSTLEHEPDAMLEALAQRVPEWRSQIDGRRNPEQRKQFSDSLGRDVAKI
ncbi:Uncharacterised protein [uncultured archaeon]|nr:Uncharacterised protein [uncultured archaeon]